MITDDQVRTYGLLSDTAVKFSLSIIVTLAFIAVTIKLLIDPTWPVAGTDGVLGYSISSVIRHYFPRRDSAGDDSKH